VRDPKNPSKWMVEKIKAPLDKFVSHRLLVVTVDPRRVSHLIATRLRSSSLILVFTSAVLLYNS
jgi:hypothetical protein